MQSVVQSSLHIFSLVGKGEGYVLTPRNHRYQPSISTVGHERVQWDHLQTADDAGRKEGYKEIKRGG